MAKSDFTQTPEQRDRANYYKGKRKSKVGSTPLLTEQMVQEEQIENLQIVQEEPVFEYGTPSYPSTQEFMASYDRGTAGMWADTISETAGQAMSVVQSAFKYMGEKKNRRADAVELDVAEKMGRMPDAMNQAMIASEESGTKFNTNKFIEEYESNTRLEGLKAMANIQYSAEEQQEIISNYLAKLQSVTPDGSDTVTYNPTVDVPFNELTTREQIQVMEIALFDRKLDPTINGERTISRVEKMRLGLNGAMNYDREAIMKRSKELKERIKNSRLAPNGFSTSKFNGEAYSSQYIDPSVQFMMDTRRGGDKDNPVAFNPVLGEDANGNPINLFNVNESGLITFSGDPEVLKREYPEMMEEIGYAQAANLYAVLGDPSFIKFAPPQIKSAAKGFTRGDTASAAVLMPYLSMGGEETVKALLNAPSDEGGAALNATQKSEILLALTFYESMESPNVNIALQKMQRISQEAFRRVKSDFDGLVKKSDDGSFKQRQSVYEVLEGLNFGNDILIDENTDLNLAQRPELSSILSLLAIVRKENIEGGEELEKQIIESSAFTPVFYTDEESGEKRLTDIIVGNEYHHAAHTASRGDAQVLIASSQIVPEPFLRTLLPDNVQENHIVPILENLALEGDNELMAEQEWTDAVIAEASTFSSVKGIQPKDLHRTMILMSPEVQEAVFIGIGEENRSYDTLEDIQKNYKDLKKRTDSSIQYKMANNSTIRTRAEHVPGAAGYAYNVDTITIDGKEIDVSDVFTSQDSSGAVFEIDWTSVPDAMETEDGKITDKVASSTTIKDVSNHIDKFVNSDGALNTTQRGWNFVIGQQGKDEIPGQGSSTDILSPIDDSSVMELTEPTDRQTNFPDRDGSFKETPFTQASESDSLETFLGKGFYQESQEILDNLTDLDPKIQYAILEQVIKENSRFSLEEGVNFEREELVKNQEPLLESIRSFTTSKSAFDNGKIMPEETVSVMLNQYFENLPESIIEEAKGVATDKNLGSMPILVLTKWQEEEEFLGGPAFNSMSREEQFKISLDMINYLKEQQLAPITRTLSDPSRSVRPEFDNPYIPEPMPSGYKNRERVIRSSLDDKPMRLESYFYTQDDSSRSQEVSSELNQPMMFLRSDREGAEQAVEKATEYEQNTVLGNSKPFILSEKDPMGQEKLVNIDRGIMNPSELSVSEYNDITLENKAIDFKSMKQAKEFILPRINDVVKEMRKRYNFDISAKKIKAIVDNTELFKVTYSGVYNRDRENANLNDLLEGIILNAIHYSYEPKPSTGDN